MRVAPERNAQASAQYLFVGGHPLHAQTLRDAEASSETLPSDGQTPCGTNPKDLLMQIQSTL